MTHPESQSERRKGEGVSSKAKKERNASDTAELELAGSAVLFDDTRYARAKSRECQEEG
jgi:hypothetical protein